MAVRTWVGRFCVAGGAVAEEGSWLGSLVRQRPDEEPDELYVLVEPASADSRQFTTQLVDVIAQLYRRDPLSLTGALQRSLRAAHEHLRDWNRRSLREHWLGAGASCLALRGSEAYVAQVGPAVAWVRTADAEIRRIAPEHPGFEASLGVAERFELTLTRVELQPGDLVLLASTPFGALIKPDHLERVLRRGDEALPELYLLCRDEPDIALILLACFEEPDQPPDFLTRDGADAPAADGVVQPADGDPAAATLALAGVGAGDEAGAPRASLSGASAGVGALDLPRRPIQEDVREIAQAAAPAAPAGLRLRGGDAAPRYRRTTGGAQLPSVRVPRLAVFAVVALIVLGLVAWWQIPGGVQESREARFTALLADARAANARAQAADDPGIKRQLLTDAKQDLDDAAKIHNDNGELLALRADVDAAIGVMDAVYEVREFTPVADLLQVVTGELSVVQAVIGGDDAYLLDAEGMRVLRLPLDGGSAPETIVAEGEFAGAMQTGRPLRIAWAEQSGLLLVIDDKRQAIGYFPDNGALPATVRGADAWGSVDALDAAGGNLYVLDVQQGQVWRYLPGDNGFDSERTGLLDPVELRDATELAVGEDVYVLDAELGIRRFAGRREVAFPLAGIDRPLVSPASLSVLPGSNRLVVADRGNKRIVVASAQGAFLRQIVSPSFTDVRAAAVDEGAGMLYVLNGDTLLRAPFPP
jgi:hypothetical protein